MSRWERFVYVLSLLAVVIAGVAYINYVQRQSDRKWCALVGRLDAAYNEAEQPAQTEIGRQVAEDLRVLHAGLDCPG